MISLKHSKILVPVLKAAGGVWLAAEMVWWAVYQLHFLNKVASFRPEDALVSMSEDDFDDVMDSVTFLLKQDSRAFWTKVTGKRCTLLGTVLLSDFYGVV